MIRLDDVLRSVPAIRDTLDLRSLAALGMTSKEVRKATDDSLAYRTYLARKYGYSVHTLPKPAAEVTYRHLCYGSSGSDRCLASRHDTNDIPVQMEFDAGYALRQFLRPGCPIPRFVIPPRPNREHVASRSLLLNACILLGGAAALIGVGAASFFLPSQLDLCRPSSGARSESSFGASGIDGLFCRGGSKVLAGVLVALYWRRRF